MTVTAALEFPIWLQTVGRGYIGEDVDLASLHQQWREERAVIRERHDYVDTDVRIGWGVTVLDAYGDLTGQVNYDYADPTAFLEIAGDLLSNLLHIAGGAGVEPEQLFERALHHFYAEVAEDESEAAAGAVPAQARQAEEVTAP